MAVGLEGVHEGPLLLGVTRPKTVCVASASRSASGSSGSVAGVDRLADVEPDRARDRATVTGLSPEMTLTATPCPAK